MRESLGAFSRPVLPLTLGWGGAYLALIYIPLLLSFNFLYRFWAAPYVVLVALLLGFWVSARTLARVARPPRAIAGSIMFAIHLLNLLATAFGLFLFIRDAYLHTGYLEETQKDSVANWAYALI